MNNLERQLLITARLYEEKLQKVLLPTDYDELQKEVFWYLMINDLVTLPWVNPLSQMLKKTYHITENDVKEFFGRFPSLEEDNGKPACDLQFEEPEEKEEEEPEETINILNDCAGCVFYNPDDDCCENNARICTYKEED